MPSITLPYTLTNGSTADATKVQDNLDEIVSEYNATVGALTGDILTTSNTKTVTNKDLSSGTNTFPSTLVTETSTDTLTNKRITKRVGTSADAATHTVDSDSYDAYTVTAQAQAFTVAAPTGTPTQGQTLIFRFKDNGTARAITWNAIFRAIGVTLPTTTVISKTLYVGAIYSTTDTKWDVIAVCQEV